MKTQIEIGAANVVTAEAYKVYLVAAAARSAAADAYDVVSANADALAIAYANAGMLSDKAESVRIAAIKLANDTLKTASDAYDAYEDAAHEANIGVA